jgi:hypothetical protein
MALGPYDRDELKEMAHQRQQEIGKGSGPDSPFNELRIPSLPFHL